MEAEKLKATHDSAAAAATELFRTKAIGENVRSFEDELNVRKSVPRIPSHIFFATMSFPSFFQGNYCQELLGEGARELEAFRRFLQRASEEVVQRAGAVCGGRLGEHHRGPGD